MPSLKQKAPNFRHKGRKRTPPAGRSRIGDLLVTLRTQEGWTLLDAERESGISDRILAKLEKGRLDTSISYLEKYLNLFGFTLSTQRKDEMEISQEKPLILDEKGLPQC